MKNSIKEILLSIMYTFRQSLKFLSPKYMNFLGGNLDLFYIFAPIYFLQNIKNKEIIYKILKIFLLLIGYAFLQIIFIPHLNYVKMFINIIKIIICYMVYLYTKEKIYDISLLNIAYYISIFISV